MCSADFVCVWVGGGGGAMQKEELDTVYKSKDQLQYSSLSEL